MEPMETENPRGSKDRSVNKREMEQMEPDIAVKEEEQSTKRRFEDLVSLEDVGGLRLFSAPLNGSLDFNYVGSLDDCEAEEKYLEETVEKLNLMSLERDRKLNLERPVPAEPDISDEVRASVDWYQTYFDTRGAPLDTEATMIAMSEELSYMRGIRSARSCSLEKCGNP